MISGSLEESANEYIRLYSAVDAALVAQTGESLDPELSRMLLQVDLGPGSKAPLKPEELTGLVAQIEQERRREREHLLGEGGERSAPVSGRVEGVADGES